MHCSSSKYIIFASLLIIVVLRWGNVEGATRWQPSIIWDRFNPLLKCKCNWMKMAELQNYDRVELVCPTPYLVSAYRTRDISRARVFYKIYMRIFNTTTHTIDQLQESLNDGSFCDPENNETKVLHYCRQDAVGDNRFFKLRFNSRQVGDIAVVFSNTITGEESDLNSTAKRCSAVFVVNVTTIGKAYDISYEKSLKQDPSNIDKCLCDKPPKPTTKPPPTRTTTLTTKPGTSSPDLTTATRVSKTSERRPTSSSETVNTSARSAGQSGKTSNDSSLWKGLFGTALVVAIIEFFILVWVKMKGKGMLTENQTPPNKLPKESKSDTAGYPNQAFTTPPFEAGKGHPNHGFAPSTPTAAPFEAGKENNFTVTFTATNGSLPSVETREKATRLPPLKITPRITSDTAL